ncbi:YbaK/EbsC family protein [Vibrio sp. WXL103]|uniref:YbaK/EbsC family protein n=1 Tax=Vibrio sp. WXL103 TaxID=3450710 RepID=UPI003EC5F7BF
MKHNIAYQQWHHEPIFDFATDIKVAKQLGWQGTHSKSLFLKTKNSNTYAVFVTDKDSRMDSKAIKNVLGQRVTICSDEEMQSQVGCFPGAVCPFGLDASVSLVIDKRLLSHDEVFYTPGKPDITFALSGKGLEQLLATLPNPVHVI